MRLSAVATIAGLVSIASAHFQLQYPAPRGPFVEDDEPTFCDGYTDAGSNRTVFPLSGGVIEINSEHPTWTVGVLVSTASNPSNFSDFNFPNGTNQLAVNFFQTSGEGLACFNINLTKSGVSGIQDGANVTVEIVFDGGDGQLYQCADLTLSSSATVPSNATSSCKDVTSAQSTSSGTSTSTSPASTGAAASLKDVTILPIAIAALVALIGAALVV